MGRRNALNYCKRHDLKAKLYPLTILLLKSCAAKDGVMVLEADLSDHEEDGLYVHEPARAILLHRAEHPPRKLYTLAHEIAHSLIPLRKRHVECYCDTFAAELLLPVPMVKASWSNGDGSVWDRYLRVKRDFDTVSWEAVSVRLIRTGLAAEHEIGEMWRERKRANEDRCRDEREAEETLFRRVIEPMIARDAGRHDSELEEIEATQLAERWRLDDADEDEQDLLSRTQGGPF